MNLHIREADKVPENAQTISIETKEWKPLETEFSGVMLDNTGKWIIKQIVDIVKQQNVDWFIVVEGGEGVGKTTLALNIFAMICELSGHNLVITIDNNLIYDEEQLLAFIAKLDDCGDENAVIRTKFQPILMDEGANILLNRESMQQKRAYILKFFNVMRFLNYIVIICTPNFQFLDKNVRTHRVKSVFRVESRGTYWYYDKNQITRMNENRHGFRWIEPKYTGTYGVNKELESITNKIKMRYIQKFAEKVKKMLSKKDKDDD